MVWMDLGGDAVDNRELIPLKDARDMLGVSHTTMARLVKEGRFTIYQNPLDRRQKLVDVAEIRQFATPAPIPRISDSEEAEERPVPPPRRRLPEDDEFRTSLQLLRLLHEAGQAHRDAPFIQTPSGDIIHPGVQEGRFNVPAALFNRLVEEGYLRVLPGVYHRRGADVGREFIITTAGLDILAGR